MEQHHHDIGIIGLGLIGCSLALGLRNPGFAGRITGMDANAEHEREALGAGLIDAVGDMKQVCGAEIIIVATPVDVSAGIIKNRRSMSEGKRSRYRRWFDQKPRYAKRRSI